MADSKTGQGDYKLSLEHFVLPIGKKVQKQTNKKGWGTCQKDIGTTQKSSKWPKLEQFKLQINIDSIIITQRIK